MLFFFRHSSSGFGLGLLKKRELCPGGALAGLGWAELLKPMNFHGRGLSRYLGKLPDDRIICTQFT